LTTAAKLLPKEAWSSAGEGDESQEGSDDEHVAELDGKDELEERTTTARADEGDERGDEEPGGEKFRSGGVADEVETLDSRRVHSDRNRRTRWPQP
jgi:hypothetical protein